MNITKYTFSVFIISAFISCTVAEPTPEENIDTPTATTLIFPENNTECNEGSVLNETQSMVNFSWSTTEFTDSYEVVLENLETNSITTTPVNMNTAEITIDRGTSYKWYVTSLSDVSDETATSDAYQFYNAGVAIENHVPFPADVSAPENDSVINSSTGKITLEWSGADIDNDIKEYEVFFDRKNSPETSIGIFTDATVEVDVVSGNTYSWLVKTTDEAGNISESEIFTFSVN